MVIEKYFKIKKKHIAPFQFIIEGYEGMATVTTIDPQTAIIKISIMPDLAENISVLLNELENVYSIIPIEKPKEEIV
ncbi:MAG TPA: DUF4911 domain-containing protein [Smithellaceae bacterium]|jgi:hypothetical protein|nr:DUF4911 domain-containing protein [Smithellaceae bacterium]HNZ30866.1 DUF4911 domain-containing protein [Smithellaceae bacterium]HOF77404.1 DUF4911 domain-containing protein [Smithellaceae bacterium]HOM68699.1 DUF4911 domain-containing protein [Smithellaceae bacterium]HOS08616.1 DUF4911 domain-containing protein [Smithellaceae bacterium]